MHIFEGRGKGATTALLLEVVRNNGVLITSYSTQNTKSQAKFMLKEEIISQSEYEYLLKNIYSTQDNLMGAVRKPIYLDGGMKLLEELSIKQYGSIPKIVALGNQDEQLSHPDDFK